MDILEQYADIISGFYFFNYKVLPEVRRQAEVAHAKQKLCIPQHAIRDAPDIHVSLPEHFDMQMLSCCLFTLLPGTDLKSMISFVLSLHTLKDILENYRSRRGIVEESDVRALYGCLSCAVDPSRSGTCAILQSSKNTPLMAKPPKCLSDLCRLQLAILPSFKQAAPKIKKYMQLYVDLQSYRHYPSPISRENLRNWCGSYLIRYPEISEWEFCAAADSFLGIAAMVAAASRPGMTHEETALLDEMCFPWLSGLCSILDAAIHIRIDSSTESLNFTSFYKNLRECEERILFFAENAEKACCRLKESSFYIRLIKTIITFYLTSPEANFNMFRLAATNIIKKSSSPAYIIPYRFMRVSNRI